MQEKDILAFIGKSVENGFEFWSKEGLAHLINSETTLDVKDAAQLAYDKRG